MSLLNCCQDTQRLLVNLLQPAEVCLLSSTCTALAALCQKTRTAILLSRCQLRARLRQARKALQQRELFLQQECKLQLPLLDSEAAQGLILERLQRSPDGIRDLAAAVQQALSVVTHQSSTAPNMLTALKDDLVRVANFVCLLAWRQHLRARRALLAAHQEPQHGVQAAGHAAAHLQGGHAPGELEFDDVQVVLLEPEMHNGHQQQQQPQQVMQLPAEQQQAMQGPIQQEQPAAASVAMSEDGSHPDLQMQQVQPAVGPQQQDQQLPAAAPAPPAAVQVVSASVQTELGPSMQEVAELVAGLKALILPSNPSLKPCRATLNLLAHHVEQQLHAWNMPVAGGAAADGVGDLAANAEAAAEDGA